MILWALLAVQSSLISCGMPPCEIPSVVAYGFPERAMAQLPGCTMLVRRFGQGGALKEGEIAQIHFAMSIEGDPELHSSRLRRLPYEFEVGAHPFWTPITAQMRVKEIRRVWLTQEAIALLQPAPAALHGDIYVEIELLSKRNRTGGPKPRQR